MSPQPHQSARAGAPRETTERAPRRRLEDWAAGYAPLPGAPDELLAPDGSVRPHWRKFMAGLGRIEPDDMAHRFAGADRRIREMGISYRVHGETTERAWPLERLPLIISEEDWRDIAAGVEQRARLAEAFLRDVYGEGRLVAEGALPAAALTGSRDFLPGLRGVDAPGGRFLRFFAVDLGRGPDGRWWVLEDRAQAPSGAGYALENRLVVSGAFPQLYRDMNVERLAPFFRDFRAGLTSAAQRSNPRICLLTPGPFSQTYFEQAYLARYLGFLLVEGDDLVARDGMVYVRTIAGLKRADVILRRVDADWCDPLEFNPASRIGAPGLMQALRNGSVAVANMPGAGLMEARALMSFAPALCRRLLGEDLRLPNIATWWCGQERERDVVRERLDELVVAGAFEHRAPGFEDRARLIGADLSAQEKARLTDALLTRGVDYVGQEIVRLSTMPVLREGRLEPRAFTLRVFAAATADGWRVMPGGFCRVSDAKDARAISMAGDVTSADVWIGADRPVETASLLPARENVRVVRMLGNLPSRAADNLFWFGRYLERAEATARLARCLAMRAVDLNAPGGSARAAVERLQRMLATSGAADMATGESQTGEIAARALSDAQMQGSALAAVSMARRAASVIRERLSQDATRLVSTLEDCLAREEPGFDPVERADEALGVMAALGGLINENMNRVAGWSFLDMGRRIERAINTCRFARQLAERDATSEHLDALLDLIDSQITYRSRYVVGPALAAVRDMALLDPYNPRSVGFQIARVDEHLAGLPALRPDGMAEQPRRISLKLAAELATRDAEELESAQVLAIEQRVMGLADAVATRYFLQGAGVARAEKPTGFA
jgi:uncharacterized circularly permuted ATP-grasp superfamily protein/uncharacterized alpha-E superfamily protein